MVVMIHRSRLHTLDICSLSHQCHLAISTDCLSQLGVMHCLQFSARGPVPAVGRTRTSVQREAEAKVCLGSNA